MSTAVLPEIRGISAFYHDQALAFIDYLSKPHSADLEAVFLEWAESKDFWPKDRRAIEAEARRLLSTRGEEASR
jgi:hypothetical protein